MAYFIIRNGIKEGPFDISELKQMKLPNDTLVWKEGFENWKQAKEVDELKEITFTPPPPIPKIKITSKEFLKIILIHLFFGFGFYYVDKNVFRKIVYPIAGFYAFLVYILGGIFTIEPFYSDDFIFSTFLISLFICYVVGYIDIFYYLHKKSLLKEN